MKRITKLKPDEIFVFGSNQAGIHGAGAAHDATTLFGAAHGIGEGLTGQCYALPTKYFTIKTRPLIHIENSVRTFLKVAASMPENKFIVTPIGCGLAGYSPADIAPMFRDAPKNCILPPEFNNL